MIENILYALKEEKEVPNIDHDAIISWFDADNSELMGKVYTIITDSRVTNKIHPALGEDEVYLFVSEYLLHCIRTNPDDEWSDGRYTAGWDLANWMYHWKKIDMEKVTRVKNALSDIYKNGDINIKNCIITAILEHIFKDQSLRNQFRDWGEDPVLKEGYVSALENS